MSDPVETPEEMATRDAPVTAEPGAGGAIRRVPPSREASLTYAAGALVAGRFRVERLLGRGGMGEVYEVHDTALDQRIALKTVPRGSADADGLASTPQAPAALGALGDRLDRELVLARRIAHPNVCRVFDLGLDERGARFVTMELVRGETLADRRARRGRLPAGEVEAIVRDLATGLVAAHAAGVIHRDLKPANVMITGADDARGEGRAVIMDFGLARDDDEQLAPVSQLAGTPAYMAPEQLAGKRPTAATDVHALGLIAAELLTGERPIGGAVAIGDRRWRRLLADCLAAEASARPTAREVLQRLDRPAPPRARWRTLVALAASLGGAALVPAVRGLARGPAHGGRTGAVEDRGARVALGFRFGGDSRDNVNALRWFAGGDLLLGGYAGVGATLGDEALSRDRGAERSGWITRTDRHGRPRWTWRTTGDVDLRVIDVAILPDGDVIAGGFYVGAAHTSDLELPAPHGGSDGFLLRLDGARGRLEWARTLGASEDAVIRSVEVDAAGAIFVGGEYAGSADFAGATVQASGGGPGSRAPFVASFAGDGRPAWVVAGHSAGASRAFGLAVDRGTVYLGAALWGAVQLGDRALPARGAGDGVVVALDAATGALRWSQLLGGGAFVAVGAVAARDGRVVTTGNFRGTIELAGARLTSSTDRSAFVGELDAATGAPRWAVAVGGEGTSNPCCVALAPDGHVFVAGKQRGDVTAGELRAPGQGDEDGFVLELDRGGRPLAIDQLGGHARDRFRRLAIAGDGRVAVAGMFARSTRMGRLELTSDGDVDGVVVELDPARPALALAAVQAPPP